MLSFVRWIGTTRGLVVFVDQDAGLDCHRGGRQLRFDQAHELTVVGGPKADAGDAALAAAPDAECHARQPEHDAHRHARRDADELLVAPQAQLGALAEAVPGVTDAAW